MSFKTKDHDQFAFKESCNKLHEKSCCVGGSDYFSVIKKMTLSTRTHCWQHSDLKVPPYPTPKIMVSTGSMPLVQVKTFKFIKSHKA